MLSQFGPLEIVLVILVVLVIFGPKRLPSLGRQLGAGMREFKESITGEGKDREEDEERPALARAQADEPAPAPAERAPAPAERTPADAPEQRR